MPSPIMKTLLTLIWLAQFYSVIGLVVWMNRDISDPRLTPQKISAAIRSQLVIMAAIALFFAGDFLFNLLARRDAPTPGSYALSGLVFLFIPAIFLLTLLKKRKRLQNRP
jgi:hypothetical protein